MLTAERLEFVKQRINHQGHYHNEDEQYQDRKKPEKEPPPSRAEPHNREQDQHENDSDNHAHQLSLGPIPEPGAPSLHGLLVMQRKPVPIQPHGKIQHVDQQ